jgi:hypothetical protein
MGESFKNVIKSIVEKNPEPLYNRGAIFIEDFEDRKKERPKSQEFQEAFPDLYDYLSQKESAKKFKVGIIHLDGIGALSRELASSGKNPLQIALTLRKMLYDGLIDIAKKMKEQPESELGQIDFLTAASRFVTIDNIVEKLGFKSFNIDNEAAKFSDVSHKRNLQTYDLLKKDNKVSEKVVKKIEEEPKPAKIVLITKQNLLDLIKKNDQI